MGGGGDLPINLAFLNIASICMYMSQKVIYVFLEEESDADWSEKILQANKHSTPSLSSEGKNKLLSQLTHIMFYTKRVRRTE